MPFPQQAQDRGRSLSARGAGAGHALLAALVLALAAAQAAATGGDTRERVETRLGNVERLIERSSGARQVMDSGSARAKSHRAAARRAYREARERFDAGDVAGADEALKTATREMFEAVRLAGRPRVLDEKEQADYEARAKSVDVLLEALQRIGAEKGGGQTTAQAVDTVRRTRVQADAVRASGDLGRARRLLDAAYALAKRSIESLRGGETLVRSLHFETKAEEYAYELDRNDTHRMLVDVLTTEKRGRPGVAAMMDRFLDEATRLRRRAEREAAAGDHARAVETLEESTKQIIRAIRATGVYIPG